MADYLPVTVDAARKISDEFRKDVVVILAWDRASNLVHTTTYGRQPADKTSAANLGEIVTKAAGCDLSSSRPFEDFRARTTAEWAQEKDALVRENERLKAAAAAYEAINRLRADPGASVEVSCDNEEGTGPNNCLVGVSAEWTGWDTLHFYGETVVAALQAAEAEKARRENEARG